MPAAIEETPAVNHSIEEASKDDEPEATQPAEDAPASAVSDDAQSADVTRRSSRRLERTLQTIEPRAAAKARSVKCAGVESACCRYHAH